MNRKKSLGFTLVEVLVALFIVSTALMAWIVSQEANARNRGMSRRITQAVEVGQSKIEELAVQARSWGYTHGEESGSDSVYVEGFTYTRSWSVDGDKIVSDGRQLWLITTEIQWMYGGSRTISLSRIVLGR